MQNKYEINTLSAIKIQASARGFFARQNYQLMHQAIEDCTSYDLNVNGNDPDIILPALSHAPEDKPVLIGTSGLRTLEIACGLGGNCPKIFLIDNSRVVIKFWKDLQSLIRKFQDTKGIFRSFRSHLSCSCSGCFVILKSLNILSDKYGFDTVKNIILNASIIRQDWADEKTFKVIGNLIKHHQYKGVYVYPSNIVAYINNDGDEKSAKSVLRNIEHLNPDLAIHTDLVLQRGGYGPKNVFYFSKDNHQVCGVFSDLTRSINPAPISVTSYVSLLVKRYTSSSDGFFNRVSPDDHADKKIMVEKTSTNLSC